MLQNFKKIFPWVLNVILLIILLWPKGTKSLSGESTIESRLKVEESLVDSFSSTREIIILERDSSLQRLDTLEIVDLVSVLKENINWYENKTASPWSLSRDSVRVVSNNHKE